MKIAVNDSKGRAVGARGAVGAMDPLQILGIPINPTSSRGGGIMPTALLLALVTQPMLQR